LHRLKVSKPADDPVHDRYRAITEKCRDLFVEEQRVKENKIITSNNLGAFYNHVNRRLSNHKGIGPLKDTNGNFVFNDNERANIFNNYFCSVCTVDNHVMPVFNIVCCNLYQILKSVICLCIMYYLN
jgi:hypothetical protein